MLRRVAIVRTNVSKERTVSIVRITKISELGKLTVTNNVLRLLVTAHVFPSSLILVIPGDDRSAFHRNLGSCKSHTT